MILDLVKLKGLSDLDEAYFDSPAFNAIRIHVGGGEAMRALRRTEVDASARCDFGKRVDS
jgi:hypothetical protein